MNSTEQDSVNDIYTVSTQTTKIQLNINEISFKRNTSLDGTGQRIDKDELLRRIINTRLIHELEGKCGENGYIKPDSVNVISLSGGYCNEQYIVFNVVYECMVCCPVDGMIIECIAREVTESAGVRAELDDINNPLKIYIARDHHITNELFHTIAVDDTIRVRVFGSRYELNDKYISVIVELLSKV